MPDGPGLTYSSVKKRWADDPSAPDFTHEEAHRLYLWVCYLVDALVRSKTGGLNG